MLIATTASLLPYVKAGRLRGLAVTGAARSRIMPELPTIAASGVAGYEYGGWYGLWAPAKTPGAVVARINEEFNRVLADVAVKERFAEVAIEPAAQRINSRRIWRPNSKNGARLPKMPASRRSRPSLDGGI